MSLASRRYRSSTSASAAPPSTVQLSNITALLDQLIQAPNAIASSYPDLPSLIRNLRAIAQHVKAGREPSRQDDFRHAGGFESILNMLRAFAGYHDPTKRSELDMLALFRLIEACLEVLAVALRNHAGNKRFFRYRVAGGGWDSLEMAIASIGLGGAEPDSWISCQVFGKLLAFAIDDDALDILCQAVAKTLRPDAGDVSQGDDDSLHDKWDLIFANPLEDIATTVREIVGTKTVVRHPEILRIVASFWTALPRQPEETVNPASSIVLETLSAVAEVSIYNRAAIHGTGVLSQFLRVAFGPASTIDTNEREQVLRICQQLMFLGVNEPADTQFLLSTSDKAASDFCLDMTSRFTGPPFFQFDLSLQGHSSLEIPTLGRAFPPQSSGGYTFTAWIRIDNIDPKTHTTLFGVFDASQTCFLLMYLEKDTQNFILQTSVFSSKPSVRFKGFAFKRKRWYHIAVVHRRPRTMVASKASLYVDGNLIEQIRCNYPSAPPLATGGQESFVSFNSNHNKTNPVQAFLGTPRDLSPHVGAALCFSQWSLASAHLLEDALSDDLIAVYHGLGPRYQGNFQDSLGGFQTYEASASLGLRNELSRPGKDENSEILRAVREKAGILLPESKILLSILPTATFPEHVQHIDTGLLRSLPRGPARNLFKASSQEGAQLATNCAVPSLSDALFRAQGLASFRGSPIVADPSYLDENLWRLAGFTPLALKLLERADDVEDVIRATEIMFHCIRNSWRNSEAMERDNGYGILGMLLRFKLGYATNTSGDVPVARLAISPEARDSLAFRILSLVLGFVGYNHAQPNESFIVNPLAFRVLLIDLDVWRRCAPRVQELYYKQFVTFSEESKFKAFNSKRLIRMRIVKRLLDAMKGEPVTEDVLPHLLGALETLIKGNPSPEIMRSLALFITFAFHHHASVGSKSSKAIYTPPSGSIAALRTSTPDTNDSPVPNPATCTLTKRQIGTRVLTMFSNILCAKGSFENIKKFARTVTNKWLLYLLAEGDPEIVMNGTKILARLLVSHGAAYTAKFANKSGGFIIMANRLKRFWDIPTIWPLCFSILFGYDVAEIDFDQDFELSKLIAIFGQKKVAYSESLQVVTSMLHIGLKDVLRHQADPQSPLRSGTSQPSSPAEGRPRARSMDLATALETRMTFSHDGDRVRSHVFVLQTVVKFLGNLHKRSVEFRNFAASSDWVRLLLAAIYPVIVSADAVTADVELNSRDSKLNFEGTDVIMHPIAGSNDGPVPVVRSTTVDLSSSPQNTPLRGSQLRRASSFVLLTSQKSHYGPSPAKLRSSVSTPKGQPQTRPSGLVLEGLIDLVMDVFMDQVMSRKDFNGFGLFSKVPPGFQEHQAYFESYLLKTLVERMTTHIRCSAMTWCETRIITNLSRLCLHLAEAIYEGWFLGGPEVMIDFCGMLLELLDRTDIASLKSVRLCHSAVASIRHCLIKVILLKLSDLDGTDVCEEEARVIMNKMAYWQTSVLNCLNADDEYLRLFWYQLYTKLVNDRSSTRVSSANFLRIIMVQKPDEATSLIRSCISTDQRQLTKDFQKLTEVDDETFITWVDEHRQSLDAAFFGSIAGTWEDFVALENQKTAETPRSRHSRRREKLAAWHAESLGNEKILINHEMGNSAWMKSIYNSEYFKYQRLLQDQQDDLAYLGPAWRKMERDLRRPGAVFADGAPAKWKLDRTEGRNRMRLRLLPDDSTQQDRLQPKTKKMEGAAALLSNSESTTPIGGMSTPSALADTDLTIGQDAEYESNGRAATASRREANFSADEDFELVADPTETANADDSFEDKNRKVMRRLEHGDQVQAAYNISRITGLEACEGILIIGKGCLYIMDNVFQCKNGDIVNVWQAPTEERDPFTQVVTGAKTLEKRQHGGGRDQDSRNWKWSDVITLSKRRFLFRDVAIEVFFTDGRSYLLTLMTAGLRDELYGKMLSKAPHINAPNTLPNPEDAWRLEVLRVNDESSGLGQRLGTFFNSSSWNPTLKRWQKGEVSNFHYLMMVNNMAGRTFNDLTQYPVFPWVLADYTSDELDLEDPKTFRDLSKPMGAQTNDRVNGFIETYNALEEIQQTPFHYGTHYSSAMIVSSYLIRLPPFVQTYLMVQGDSFDHADRLFHSIPDAWVSASRKNKTDVRELIPEFYCLPDFLTNINAYDFGRRQSNNLAVNDVVLPPWAKGDPKIFIAKHRQALESPYVSENLHKWIDLVFGCKQRGEAAVENLNVFHHLSYAGASDLDRIEDAGERAITAGVIHNFGQTPHQVFQRSHPAKDIAAQPKKRLDTAIFSLTCLPSPLLESHERVASLIYAPKLDRLLCASALRLNFAPYDKYLSWGYADHSVRFFFSDNRKPAGLFENLHIGQISCITFADSKTLITGGEDCVVSVFNLQTSPGKPVELVPRTSLFGHKTMVTTMAVSKAFSTLLTISSDGQALLWDLNQLSFIRKLPLVRPADCAAINDVTGEIVIGTGPNILLYTLNGSLLIDVKVCLEPHDYVHSVAFYEGDGNEWLENQVIFTGHGRGRVNVWRVSVNSGKWSLDMMRRLDHIDYQGNGGSAGGKNMESGITCVKPLPTCLYTGDDLGRVYEWNLTGRDR